MSALAQQDVVVTVGRAVAHIVPRLAEQLTTQRRQRADVAARVEELVDGHPLSPVLASMPGVGFRTAAHILAEVTSKELTTKATWRPTPVQRRHHTAPAPRYEASTNPGAATSA